MLRRPTFSLRLIRNRFGEGALHTLTLDIFAFFQVCRDRSTIGCSVDKYTNTFYKYNNLHSPNFCMSSVLKGCWQFITGIFCVIIVKGEYRCGGAGAVRRKRTFESRPFAALILLDPVCARKHTRFRRRFPRAVARRRSFASSNHIILQHVTLYKGLEQQVLLLDGYIEEQIVLVVQAFYRYRGLEDTYSGVLYALSLKTRKQDVSHVLYVLEAWSITEGLTP